MIPMKSLRVWIRPCPCVTYGKTLDSVWSHDTLQYNVGPVFTMLHYGRRPWGGGMTLAFIWVIMMQHKDTRHKPGLHAVCGKHHSVLDCYLFSNARYEESQIELRVGGFLHFKQTLLSCFCFFFSVCVCAGGGGGIYRWVPGRWWITQIGNSAETLKHTTEHSPVYIYWVLQECFNLQIHILNIL